MKKSSSNRRKTTKSQEDYRQPNEFSSEMDEFDEGRIRTRPRFSRNEPEYNVDQDRSYSRGYGDDPESHWETEGRDASSYASQYSGSYSNPYRDRREESSERGFYGGSQSGGDFTRNQRRKSFEGAGMERGQGGSFGAEYGGNPSMGRGPHFGKGPQGYRRSDERIREDVCETLMRDHNVDATHIDVTVDDGIVTLKGTVEDRPMKRRAEEIIENLTSVLDIRNELRIEAGGISRTMAEDYYSGSLSGSKKTSRKSESSSKRVQ